MGEVAEGLIFFSAEKERKRVVEYKRKNELWRLAIERRDKERKEKYTIVTGQP